MAARGVVVSYETIRRSCDKFGQLYAAGLRKRRRATGDKWHVDEVFLNINGVRHYLWRAVDQNGVVIDILVQPKRDRFAAIRFFRKLLRATAHRRPRVIVTDKLRSCAHAQRFVEVHGIIGSHFRPRCYLLSAADYSQLRSERFRVWNEVTGATALGVSHGELRNKLLVAEATHICR